MHKKYKVLNIKKNKVAFKVIPNDNDLVFWSEFIKKKWEDDFLNIYKN
jgi:hypothetical protein